MKTRLFRTRGYLPLTVISILIAALALSPSAQAGPAATTFAIAATDADKDEPDSGAEAFTFTVTRSGVTSGTNTVDYSISGSGSNPAGNSDISGSFPLTGTLTFNAGEITQTITVNVRGNTTVEPDEEFTVTLSNASADTLITTATATGVIRNDDTEIRIGRQHGGAVEGDSGTNVISFPIVREGATPAATMDYTVSGTGNQATDATDFGGAFPSGTISWSAGETHLTLSILYSGDTTVESNEVFQVVLANTSDGARFEQSTAKASILDDDAASSGDPLVVESFSLFTTLTGSTPLTGAADTGVGFEVEDYEEGSTTTSTGFALDTAQALDGHALHFESAENTALINRTNLNENGFNARSHMVAFWFRFSDNTTSGSNKRTQLIGITEQIEPDPSLPFYQVELGTDGSGQLGAGVYGTQPDESFEAIGFTSLTADTWHQCVIQYSAPSLNNSGDAGMQVWFNPTSGGAGANIQLDPSADQLVSFNSNGSVGRMAFGSMVNESTAGGPDVYIDCVGIWDGFGVSGHSDLSAAINFLNNCANVTTTDPVITWSDPADITFGELLSATQLDATADAAGSFTYSPASGTLLNAGNGQILSAIFTPSNTTLYNSVTQTVTINVSKADPIITWSNLTAVSYGAALSSTQLSAGANVIGSFAYSPASGTILDAGNGQALAAMFTPNDTLNYNVVSATNTIDVAKAIPTVIWNNPADIVFGTALSSLQLDATADVGGTFVFNPATGTVLNAGANQTLEAVFTPTDTANFEGVTNTVAINVAKADPSITWYSVSAITFGAALSTNELNAMANVAGAFTYSPTSGTVLSAGSNQVLTADFTPTDTNNYNPASATNTIDVAKFTPTITWTNPADIGFGTALSATQLNAASDVPGTFAYTPAIGAILFADDAQTLSVTFTPDFPAGYDSATATVTINVLKADPTITWADPAPIVFGAALSGTQLNATSDVGGSFTYDPIAGTFLPGGSNQTLSVSFTSSDTNFNNATAIVSIDVLRATPTISWSNPADITVGTALSSTQLNASANVAGTFEYDPAAGATLPAGDAQSLNTTFTPDNTNNYENASASVAIKVLKADPILTWTNPADITAGTALSATQLNATASVAGSFAYSPAAGTVLPAGTDQALSVIFTPTDTATYNSVTGMVAIDVTAGAPAITWANPADIAFGTALSATQLNATADVPGAFSYSPTAGTVLDASNNQTLSLQFTPTDTASYSLATATVSINVLKADPTITWNPLSPVAPGTTLGADQLNASADISGSFSYAPGSGTVITSNTTVTATFTPTDTSNYNSANAMATVSVQSSGTVVDNFANASTGGRTLLPGGAFAQPFLVTTQAFTLTDLKIRLARELPQNATAIVSLRAHDPMRNGPGPVLEMWPPLNLTSGQVPNHTEFTFASANNVTLVENMKYWIVAEVPPGPGGPVNWEKTSDPMNSGSGVMEPLAFNPALPQMMPFIHSDPAEFFFAVVNGAATVVTPPTFNLAPADANKAEGNDGTTPFVFTIARGGDLNAPMAAVAWNIMGAGPNPAAPDDFEFGGVFPGGVVSFAPGQTTTNITVPVRGDTVPEANEEFLVRLADPQFGAQLGTAGALGTIQNDDGVTQLDFGDAPDPSIGAGAGNYQTLAIDNGARHNAIGPALGALRDAESDGNQSGMADGDDMTNTDDEDGVLLPPLWRPGQTQPVHAIVTFAPAGAKLNAWIDWNHDGIWSPTEQIAVDLTVNNGTNTFMITTPTNAMTGATFARFRIDTVGGLTPLGAAPDGEVEDYEVTVATPAGLAAIQTGGNTAVAEGGANDTLEIRLLGAPMADVTVTVTPTGNDIDLGNGAGTPLNLTFTSANAGTSQTITVTAIDDATVEGPETEPVTFATTSSDSDFNNLMHPPVVVVIADNDVAVEPTLSITIITNEQPEGSGSFTPFVLRVNRTGDTNSAVSAQWQATGNGPNPAMPDDFNAAGSFPGGIVNLAPGQFTADLSLPVVADFDPEPDEGFTVTLSSPIAAQIGTGSASMTILNDDAFDFGDAPLPFPTVRTNNGAHHHLSGPVLGLERDADMDGQPNPNADGDDVADGSDDEDGVRLLGPLVPGRIANFEVLVSAAPLGAHLDAWIDWNNDLSWNDPGERIAVSFSVMDGSNSLAIMVPTNAALQNVHARFRLSGLGGLSVDGPAPDGEVEDHRFQVVPPAKFTITADMANQPEGDSGTNGYTFTIHRTGDVNAPMTSVGWAVLGSGPNPADGADFEFGGVLPGGGFSFAPGQTSTNLTVIVRGDTIAEPDEGFVVVLTNAAFGAIIGNPASAPGLIVNDDTNLVTEYSLTGRFLTSRAESDDPLTQTNLFNFLVSRTGDPNAPAVIAWNVTGFGANPATPSDFGGVFPGGVVNFAPGQLSANIAVRVLGDVFIEPDEQFLVSLAAPQLGGALSSQSNVVATIRNDDFGPTFISVIAPPDQPEGDTGTSTFDFVIQRAGDTNGMITVFFDVLGAPPNPVDNQDGQIGSDLFFTILPGVSSVTLGVPIFGDTVPEPDEFLQVRLHTVFGAQATATSAVARVINDDVEYDFGDLLFLTTLSQNGARHAAIGPRLGELRDHETDGLPSLIAEGDDTDGIDDEDGVRPITPLIAGQTAEFEIIVSATNDARLHAWIDWNNNSNWNDPGEQIASNHPMLNGTNILSVNVPTNASPSGNYARFRLASAGLTPAGMAVPSLSFDGPAADGEVEDYRFVLAQPPAFEIGSLVADQFEGNTNTSAYTFTITRSGAINAPMAAAQWMVEPATPPVDGADFDFGGVFPGGAFNFAPGQTTTNITILVRGDLEPEADERFRVVLSNPAFGAVLGPNRTAEGVIRNDDASAALEIRLLSFANGDSRIEITGPPSMNVVLEASSDLAVWSPVNSGTIPIGQPLVLMESSAQQLPARFYRVRETTAP